MIALWLLAAYGICFGIQNKLVFLRGKHNTLDKLLECTYCTGFHAGWITWLAYDGYRLVTEPWCFIELLGFAFASSAFCYFLDTAIRLMESHADPLG
jgi:hypothetical protein